jgi:hypothetical protein
MKSIRKPSLIFGLIITVIFFIGFFMLAGENPNGTILLYAGLVLGGIYWIWSIIAVGATDDLKRYQKTFWLIIVVTVPFLGALLYGILHQNRNKMVA